MPRGRISEQKTVSAKNYEAILALASRRIAGEPLQHVLGETDFYGCRLQVEPGVFIPRFETEEVAEFAAERIKPEHSVLDLCTGSGCIALAVQKKTGARVTASDISAEALALAKRNAEENGVTVDFMLSDMFEAIEEKFDVILSNPPYIATAEIGTLDPVVRDFEPGAALDGGEDGLKFYRVIAAEAKNYLRAGGLIVLEIGAGQAEAVSALFAGYADVQVKKDIYGSDRIFSARLPEAGA
jgi:release factor glutamine methyltransferase